jgi:hypothetical protein
MTYLTRFGGRRAPLDERAIEPHGSLYARLPVYFSSSAQASVPYLPFHSS